ncbi:unnamed protein product [Cyclocybe aegerita]|uniref:threonine synthase n=1 Tax=Cyclocybe aegerita TaxID=1973307 RepID=A0A8S0VUB3_CYCAE|nr:unnamed protein product [Cyclocybe aegerita]
MNGGHHKYERNNLEHEGMCKLEESERRMGKKEADKEAEAVEGHENGGQDHEGMQARQWQWRCKRVHPPSSCRPSARACSLEDSEQAPAAGQNGDEHDTRHNARQRRHQLIEGDHKRWLGDDEDEDARWQPRPQPWTPTYPGCLPDRTRRHHLPHPEPQLLPPLYPPPVKGHQRQGRQEISKDGPNTSTTARQQGDDDCEDDRDGFTRAKKTAQQSPQDSDSCENSKRSSSTTVTGTMTKARGREDGEQQARERAFPLRAIICIRRVNKKQNFNLSRIHHVAMKYFSTRGGDQRLSFEETVLTGLAPNGGLYIPERIPSLPEGWRTKWRDYSFAELSVAVLSLFISPNEISTEELRSLVEKSYATFRHPDVTPTKKLNNKLFVLELFHGPTFAFKDVALQLLGNLFEFFLLRRNARKAVGEKQEKLTVVGATSGDTGSAAIYGLRNKANISIFILHPKGRVSPIQEAQMTTVTDANVHNVAVKGTFDDCQDIVKALFADKEFNAKHRLGAVNSINWARILAQTVYYFLSFFHFQSQLPASTSPDDVEIQYVVPTGNFGDILAGYYAKKLGLPIGKLVVSTNSNDILARFWKSGKYEKADSSVPVAEGAAASAQGSSDGKQATDSSGVKETLSPAMDILVSSNFERLLWYLAYENAPGATGAEKHEAACSTLDSWMGHMKANGRVEVPVEVLETARKDFVAERVSDELTLETIKSYFEGEPSYVADPHTAVGLAAARITALSNAPNVHQIVLSTAHPAKFSEAVSCALQGLPSFDFDRDVLPEEFQGLLEKEKRVIDVEKADITLVKNVIESVVPKEVGGGAGASTGGV